MWLSSWEQHIAVLRSWTFERLDFCDSIFAHLLTTHIAPWITKTTAFPNRKPQIWKSELVIHNRKSGLGGNGDSTWTETGERLNMQMDRVNGQTTYKNRTLSMVFRSTPKTPTHDLPLTSPGNPPTSYKLDSLEVSPLSLRNSPTNQTNSPVTIDPK